MERAHWVIRFDQLDLRSRERLLDEPRAIEVRRWFRSDTSRSDWLVLAWSGIFDRDCYSCRNSDIENAKIGLMLMRMRIRHKHCQL